MFGFRELQYEKRNPPTNPFWQFVLGLERQRRSPPMALVPAVDVTLARAHFELRPPSVSLGLLAVFRNEAQIMTEWVRHYRHEGVTQFVVVSDNSTDGGDDVARSLGLTVFEKDPDLVDQAAVYSRYLPFVTTDWLLIADLDEFMFARQPEGAASETIVSYLSRLDATPMGRQCGSIQVPWTLYASSNATRHPVSAIGSQQYRVARTEARRGTINFKSLTRRSRMCSHNPAWVHTSATMDSYCLPTDPPTVRTDVNFSCADWDQMHDVVPTPASVRDKLTRLWSNISFYPGIPPAPDHVLKVNHYVLQSWEFWCKVKEGRNSLFRGADTKVQPGGLPADHSQAYYEYYNSLFSAAYDDELYRKRGAAFVADLPRRRAWPPESETANHTYECDRAAPLHPVYPKGPHPTK